MKRLLSKTKQPKFFGMALGFVLLCGRVGFAEVGLEDLRAAILQEDYAHCQELTKEFLTQEASSASEKQEALYLLGLSQLNLQETALARGTFEQLLKENPSAFLKDKAMIGIIDAFYLEGDYDQGLKMAEELLVLSPSSESLSLILLKLARGNMKLTRWAKSRAYLKEILNRFPDSLEAHLARQLLKERQYFAVQVGSFLERQRAEGLIRQLRSQKYYAYILETKDRDGNKFYRVRVGKLTSLAQAGQLESDLAQRGYPTHIFP